MKNLVFIPVANEAESIEVFLQSLIEVRNQSFFKFDILLIHDAFSIDNTTEIIKDYTSRFPFISDEFFANSTGPVSCYLYGYTYAIKNNYEYCIEMDSGFSHPPNKIPLIFEKLHQGYECVFMSRFKAKNSIINMPIYRVFLSKLATIISRLLFNVNLSDFSGGFNGFRTKEILDIVLFNQYVKGSGFHIQIKLLSKNLKWIELPYVYKGSKTSFSIHWMVQAIYALYIMKTQSNAK